MKKLILFVVSCLLSLPSRSQSLLSYYRDTEKVFTPKLIIQIPFKTYPKNTINFGKDSSNHWMKIQIKNEENIDNKYFVELGFPWLDSVSYYSAKGNLIKSFSWKTPLNERYFEHQNFVLPIELNAHRDTTIYCRFYKKTMLINGTINIAKESFFLRIKSFDYAFFGVFGGIMLTISLFSMFLFLVSKESIYLYYSGYSLLYILFNLSLQGYFLPIYQKGFWIITANEIDSWFLWFSQMCMMYFIRAFLWEKKTLPNWLKNVWKTSIILMNCIIFLKTIWIFYINKYNDVPNSILLAITFCFLSSVITGFLLAIVALIKNINPLATKLYFVGIIPFFLFSIFSYVRNFGLIENHWLLGAHSMAACIAFDVLVLMVGLGFRYRNLRLEKEKQTRLAIENQLRLLQEKERISRDLHDNVGSQLTIISSGIDNAAYLAEKKKLNPEKLLQINETVRETVQNLRDSIWATHQNEISIDNFQTRLRQYLAKSVSDNLTFHVNLAGQNVLLSSTLALTLFRIIQEAIQNSLKHAKASEISINGQFEDEKGKIEITDNGTGFNTNQIANAESYGLNNMKQRIEDLAGNIKILSQPNEGTKIILEFLTK